MKKGENSKKALSPVIATILLVMMVVVIAAIIFLWFRNMSEETITKFENKNIKLVCADVNFEASYSNNQLYLANNGEVPIFGIEVKVSGVGGYETKSLSSLDRNGWGYGLNPGERYSTDIESMISSSTEEIILIPILIGTSDDGQKTFKCDERQYGYEITI